MKKIILACLLTAGIFFLKQDEISAGTKFSFENQNDPNVKQSHSFVRVYLDGQWWVYEYDEDGKIINVYPEED